MSPGKEWPVGSLGRDAGKKEDGGESWKLGFEELEKHHQSLHRTP
jgi:hypothetical protein